MRNEVVRQELEVEPILKKIHKQLKWFGHLRRMNDNRSVKKFWHTEMTGKGKKGTPEENMGKFNSEDSKRKKCYME